MGDLSPHFSRSEFRCHGFGKDGHPAHETPVDAQLVAMLEELRRMDGDRPLVIVSGHRCTWWNAKVGGAGGSLHIAGMAVDLQPATYTVLRAEAAGFRGIGVTRSWALHVDVRSISARWSYPG